MKFSKSSQTALIVGCFCILLSYANTVLAAEACDPQIAEAQKAAGTLAAQNQLEVHQRAHEPTPSVHQLTCSDKTAQEDGAKAGKIFSDIGTGAANLAQNVGQTVVASGKSYIQSSFSSMLSGGSFSSTVPLNFGSLIPSIGSLGLGGAASPCNSMKQFSDAARAAPFMQSGMEFMDMKQFASIGGSRVPGAAGLASSIKQDLSSMATNAAFGATGTLTDRPGGFSFRGPNSTAATKRIDATIYQGTCSKAIVLYSGATVSSNPADPTSGKPACFCSISQCSCINGTCQ